MENQGFSQRGTSLALSYSSCTKIIELLFYSPSKQHTRVPTSVCSIGKPNEGYNESRPLNLAYSEQHVLQCRCQPMPTQPIYSGRGAVFCFSVYPGVLSTGRLGCRRVVVVLKKSKNYISNHSIVVLVFHLSSGNVHSACSSHHAIHATIVVSLGTILLLW